MAAPLHEYMGETVGRHRPGMQQIPLPQLLSLLLHMQAGDRLLLLSAFVDAHGKAQELVRRHLATLSSPDGDNGNQHTNVDEDEAAAAAAGAVVRESESEVAAAVAYAHGVRCNGMCSGRCLVSIPACHW